jgi:hypothetical protein
MAERLRVKGGERKRLNGRKNEYVIVLEGQIGARHTALVKQRIWNRDEDSAGTSV